MYSSPWFDFVICFFFGLFGVHRFRVRQYAWGFAYLFTVGFGGLGWFIDCIRYFVAALQGRKIWGNLMPPYVIQATIDVTPTVTTVSQGNMRYSQPSYRAPAPSGRTLSDNEPLPVVPSNLLLRDDDVCRYCDRAAIVMGQQVFEGVLSITDRRVVFSSDGCAFDQRIEQLSSVTPYEDAISFQFGSLQHTLYTADSTYIAQLMLRIINLGE